MLGEGGVTGYILDMVWGEGEGENIFVTETLVKSALKNGDD